MNEYDMKLKDVLFSGDKDIISNYSDCLDVYLADPLVKRKIKLIAKLKSILEQRSVEELNGINYSIMELYHIIEVEREKNVSHTLFPGHSIVLYPKILELKAKRDIVCSFSCEQIKKNSSYYNYGFFMEDLDNKSKYVLDHKLNVATQYYYLLPQNISELEKFNENLSKAYENGDEYFYNISTNLKCDKLKIRKTR